MEIVCQNCQSKFNLPDQKIPADRSASLPCPKCKNKDIIECDDLHKWIYTADRPQREYKRRTQMAIHFNNRKTLKVKAESYSSLTFFIYPYRGNKDELH